jgi:hypothetical protein
MPPVAPLVPPVPPAQGGIPAAQVSNCVQSEILRQFAVADSIAEAFVQAVPLWPPLPDDDDEQSVVAVAVLASARHIASFTQNCWKVSELPPEPEDPHP